MKLAVAVLAVLLLWTIYPPLVRGLGRALLVMLAAAAVFGAVVWLSAQ